MSWLQIFTTAFSPTVNPNGGSQWYIPVPPSSICTDSFAILAFELWPSRQKELLAWISRRLNILPSVSFTKLSLPCLFVTLPLEKWHHFFSKTRPALQARLLAHSKRHCASQDFPLSEVQSLQQFLSPLHYLGSSNMLICRFCSSTLYHQIALFSLPWDGSNTVLLVGKVVPLEIFLVAQVSQQSKSPLNICKKKKKNVLHQTGRLNGKGNRRSGECTGSGGFFHFFIVLPDPCKCEPWKASLSLFFFFCKNCAFEIYARWIKWRKMGCRWQELTVWLLAGQQQHLVTVSLMFWN